MYLYAALFFFLLILLITFIYGALSGAPWVPTRGVDISRFLKLSDLKPEEKFYDLGSGDGRLVCSVAKVGGVSQGYEVSLFPYIVSKIRRLFLRNRKLCTIR